MKGIWIYSLKCWLTGYVGGLIGFGIIEFFLIKPNTSLDNMFVLLLLLLAISFIGSIPLFSIYLWTNSFLSGYASTTYEFKVLISRISSVTCLLLTIGIFGTEFYKSLDQLLTSNRIDYIFIPYLISLLFGIWKYNLVLEQELPILNYEEDDLDTEI